MNSQPSRQALKAFDICSAHELQKSIFKRSKMLSLLGAPVYAVEVIELFLTHMAVGFRCVFFLVNKCY